MEGKFFYMHSQNPLRTSGLIKRSNRYSRFVSCLTKWELFSHCTHVYEIDIQVTGDVGNGGSGTSSFPGKDSRMEMS